MAEIKNENSGKSGKFIITENGENAGEMLYNVSGGVMNVTHTGVEKKFEGMGFAKKMLEEMARFAREKNLRVNAICPFVAKQFAKSADYDDIKA